MEPSAAPKQEMSVLVPSTTNSGGAAMVYISLNNTSQPKKTSGLASLFTATFSFNFNL